MKKQIQKGLIRIGLRVRQYRKRRNLTLEDVAGRAEISKGLLSKIENYRVTPSLPVLIRIAYGLRIEPGELLKGIGTDSDDSDDYILVKANERDTLERDEGMGFLYQAITCQSTGTITFDSFVLTLTSESQREPATTEGDEFIYILKGNIDFLLGQKHLALSQNDALYFDGRIPHVPTNQGLSDAQILVIYLLKNE